MASRKIAKGQMEYYNEMKEKKAQADLLDSIPPWEEYTNNNRSS